MNKHFKTILGLFLLVFALQCANQKIPVDQASLQGTWKGTEGSTKITFIFDSANVTTFLDSKGLKGTFTASGEKLDCAYNQVSYDTGSSWTTGNTSNVSYEAYFKDDAKSVLVLNGTEFRK